MTVSLASLLVQSTKAVIYDLGLSVATSLSLPVTTWGAGDPTRSTYHFVAEILAAVEEKVALYIAAGFLDYAEDDWLILLAEQVYGVVVPEATQGTCSVTLTNASGAVYVFDAGDITFKNSSTDKTYKNTTGGTLSALSTLVVDVEADEAGSESNAAIGEIDELVTTYLGVTCTNTTACVGTDRPTDPEIRDLCREKLASLSPNGPADAYSYVAKNADLTGVTGITRTRVFGESDTGDVTVYLAGPAGAVTGPEATAATDAITTWATPLCITPTVASATNAVVSVTYELWLYSSVNKSQAEVESAVEAALLALLRTRPIGGDIKPPATTGKIYVSLIRAAIRATFPDHVFDVVVTVPAADVDLTNIQVATLGAVTATAVHFVADP